jgi:hypothetical protein
MEHAITTAIDVLKQARASHDLTRKNELIDSALEVLTMASGPTLSWQESDVLDMLKRMGARPAQPTFPQQCIAHWTNSGKALGEMWKGFDELEAKGYIGRNQQGTAFQLTDAGYQLIR